MSELDVGVGSIGCRVQGSELDEEASSVVCHVADTRPRPPQVGCDGCPVSAHASPRRDGEPAASRGAGNTAVGADVSTSARRTGPGGIVVASAAMGALALGNVTSAGASGATSAPPQATRHRLSKPFQKVRMASTVSARSRRFLSSAQPAQHGLRLGAELPRRRSELGGVAISVGQPDVMGYRGAQAG